MTSYQDNDVIGYVATRNYHAVILCNDCLDAWERSDLKALPRKQVIASITFEEAGNEMPPYCTDGPPVCEDCHLQLPTRGEP